MKVGKWEGKIRLGIFFFFQAEDGIRDISVWLEFRRVLFRSQISRDLLVDSIFENFVVIEFLKLRFNQGKMANFYFYKGSNQLDHVLSVV